ERGEVVGDRGGGDACLARHAAMGHARDAVAFDHPQGGFDDLLAALLAAGLAAVALHGGHVADLPNSTRTTPATTSPSPAIMVTFSRWPRKTTPTRAMRAVPNAAQIAEATPTGIPAFSTRDSR